MIAIVECMKKVNQNMISEQFKTIARKEIYKMKIKDLIRELSEFDENLDIEVR